MAHFINEIYQRYRNENIVGKFIYLNVAVYLFFVIVGVVATLMNIVSPIAEGVSWLQLPSNPGRFILQPWSIVTYMFMHGSFMHILWNMFALYMFGRIFLTFYSTRHFIGVYMLGGVTGGLVFVLAYNIFPYFEGAVGSSYLVGASAAVLAVIAAAAVRSPNYVINLMLFGSVKLKTLAIVTVLLSLLLLSSENAGGNFAHIGGAVAGWIFAVMLDKGTDVTSLGDAFSALYKRVAGFIASFVKKRPKGPRMDSTQKSNYTKRAGDYEYNSNKKQQEDEMNTILEKIKQSGYSSLTEDEKRRLFNASKR